MKEIQGKSTLVRVSEGSSYRESTVLLSCEVVAAMLVDKNKSFFLCWEVNSFLANSAKKYIVLPPYHVVRNKAKLFPILGKFRNRKLFIDWNNKMSYHLIPL